MNARVSSANFAGCPGAADESGSFEIATPAKAQATPRSIWRRVRFLSQFDVEPSITSFRYETKSFPWRRGWADGCPFRHGGWTAGDLAADQAIGVGGNRSLLSTDGRRAPIHRTQDRGIRRETKSIVVSRFFVPGSLCQIGPAQSRAFPNHYRGGRSAPAGEDGTVWG